LGSIGFLYDCVNHVRNQFERKTLEWSGKTATALLYILLLAL
jgi:hypothetical protein